MAFTIEEIAKALEAEAFGALDIEVTGPAEPAMAGPDQLALAMDPKYAEGLSQGQAQAAVVWPGADWKALGLKAAITAPRSRYAMSGLTKLMDPGLDIPKGIHASAVVDPSAQIGAGAAIGPFVVIGANVEIGPGAVIDSHVSIGRGVRIGDSPVLHAGVRIGASAQIGDRFIAQPGAVVGGDGFSFVTPEKSSAEKVRETLGDQGEIVKQSWTRIHSLGSVHIGDDVEIGANAAVDRGTIRATSIGNGTKIDSLVMVAHNVSVGNDCLLCGLVGIAGSTTIGDRVILAGQSGVVDNTAIGDDVVVGAGTKVLSKVPTGRVVLGYPAMKMETYIDATKNWRRLPRLMDSVKELQKEVSKLSKSD